MAAAFAFAKSSLASATAMISTLPSRRAASTCAGPMKPVPIIPAAIFDAMRNLSVFYPRRGQRKLPAGYRNGPGDGAPQNTDSMPRETEIATGPTVFFRRSRGPDQGPCRGPYGQASFVAKSCV